VFSQDTDAGIGPVAEILCWLVFAVDLAVHVWWRRNYLRTRQGWFDLAIVLITFPWFLFFDPESGTGFLVVARLARLLRVAYVGGKNARGLRRVGERIGRVALYALAACIVCSLVVRSAEPPSSGFANFGDAFWWSLVTITTVGYGDLVPVTTGGRIAAVVLMIAGIALLGALAGVLASFLRTQDQDDDGSGGDEVLAAVAELRAELATLSERLDATRADNSDGRLS
jgi:voltage-gated potassium channel